MEDIDFSRRLRRQGRLTCLRLRVITSARKWEREGVLRTIALMWTLRLLYHVGVHPALRGQGVAGRLVEASLEYAKEKALRVIPMCSYAAAFMRRHPDYAELMNQERSE